MKRELVFVIGVLAVGTASADTIDVLRNKVDGANSTAWKYTYNGNTSSTHAGIYYLYTKNASAGNEKLNDTYNDGALDGDVVAFCIDLRQYWPTQWANYNIVDPALAPAPPISGGSGAMGQIKATALAKFWFQFGNSVVDAATRSAFQLAVWEIVTENWVVGNQDTGTADKTKLDIRSNTAANNFYITPKENTNQDAILTTVNSWFASFNLASTNQIGLVALSFDDPNTTKYQDYIVRKDGGGTQVPSPSALVGLLSLGLVGLLGWRRRATRV